jgi:hypothetical protein
MNIELILLGILIILSLPLIGYNMKIIIIAILIFFLCYPEQRANILNNPIIKETYKKIKGGLKEGLKGNSNVSILIDEGDTVILSLNELKLKKPLNGQLTPIHITWNNFVKLIKKIFNSESSSDMAYSHHHYETLRDHRKKLLNQLSSLIVASSPGKDEKIRLTIKKMSYITDQLMLLLENKINGVWDNNPYNKINPVQWMSPQPYDKDDVETIL